MGGRARGRHEANPRRTRGRAWGAAAGDTSIEDKSGTFLLCQQGDIFMVARHMVRGVLQRRVDLLYYAPFPARLPARFPFPMRGRGVRGLRAPLWRTAQSCGPI